MAVNANAEDDLPARVGRVADYAGELYLASQERAAEWHAIGINYPVIQGDSLSVSPEGRAEIDFGFAQVRLAGDTSAQVSALEDHRFGLFVHSGSSILHLRSLDPGESALVDSPHAQIHLDRPGVYRIEVDEQRQKTSLAVRAGEAEVRFAGGSQQILPGQMITVAGPDPADISLQIGIGSDGFDVWSALRDRGYDTSPYVTFVSPEMVGAAELDNYGTWESYAPYGEVWFPTTVAVGWAPYRFGHWVWLRLWGWTWVDDAPWGYAPFHYGRWVWFSGRWGWCPGPVVQRPPWAPALVAWYGGPGWAFSRSVGAPVYGWVPLGWGDVFSPNWRCSTTCWRALNRPFAVNVAERPTTAPTRFSNANVPGALSIVPGSVLGTGRPVNANLLRPAASVAGAAPPLSEAPAVAASRPAAARLPGSAARWTPSARAGFPAASTADRGGAPINASPTRELSSKAGAPRAATIPGKRVYGGVTDGRGAYTGIAPTPGPKLPLAYERGTSVSPVPGNPAPLPSPLGSRGTAVPGIPAPPAAGPPPR